VGEARDLIDRGIRAYMQGRAGEARALFEEALRADPGNVRAASYLVLVRGGAEGASAPADGGARGDGSPASKVAAAWVGDDAREGGAPSPWDDGPAPAATFVLDPAGGLDLSAIAEKSDLRPLVPEAARSPVPAPAARNDVNVWMQAARELHSLGDFTGSLELIEKILQIDPDHGEAREYLAQNEATLITMYESKLGSLHAVPRLAIKPEEVMWLNLDHRAGFLLAQIDGSVDYESIFALSGLPRLDTVRILATLVQDGVIRS
jgi:tetratricopeptide (TPR) repeat protein